MKIIKLSIFLFCLDMLIGCKEEKHSPHFTDEAPSILAQYSVENLPGAAAISYKLADDSHTAYVKAVYTLKEGLTREAKASKYDNKLMVDGFSESKEYTVALYTVGEDEQMSDPVYISVHPDTPPYQKVAAELDVKPDWGGGKIKGANATSAKLMIGVLKKDPTTGEWVDVEVFFTENQSFNFNFRGLDPVETQFGVYTRDQWQNFSDTVTATFEPWEEIRLPLTQNNFNPIILPGDALGQAAYGLKRIFDGANFSWSDGYYSLNDGTPFPKVITIDLLETYQLSRFKYFQNGNLYYQSANAKHIRIWGNATLNLDYTTWTLLGEWDNWRPSGRPASTGNAGLTDEDKIAAQAGNDFDFNLEIPGVRYIRIEALNTWEPRTQVYYPELQFWGRKIK
ncbi:protein of unknown function [bacterium A37T11]|nr:protein of unknown function [bacterium A37T11]